MPALRGRRPGPLRAAAVRAAPAVRPGGGGRLSPGPRRIGAEERRARLAARHHLGPAARAATAEDVTAGVVALHATDPSSVHLAALARLAVPDVAALERALYDDRTVLRMLGMRRTMFVVPVDLAPVVQAAATDRIAAAERVRLQGFVAESGIADDPARWLAPVEEAALAALAEKGEATAAELSAAVPAMRTPLRLGEGTRWATTQGVGPRVLLVLAAEGKVVRGRPRGSWVSSQYRWAPTARWLGADLPRVPAGAAKAELARRWLAAFGPATAGDLKWWTGWTVADVRQAVAALDTVEVEVDGAAALVLAGDDEPVASPAPWAALLPALDPTVMGWAERGWYLGEHRAALFDRSGNAGPTVWWDGRVVGGWAQRGDGGIAVRLLEDVGAEAVAAVDAEVERLARAVGDVRFTPRFRTPLERELAASRPGTGG